MESLKRLLGFKRSQILEDRLTELLEKLLERTSGADTVFLTKPDGLVVAKAHTGPPEQSIMYSAVGAEIAEVSAEPLHRLFESKTNYIIAITDQMTIGLARLKYNLILGVSGKNLSIAWMLKWLGQTSTKINNLFDSMFYETEPKKLQDVA
ncbi:MAG: hypothetical protein ACE5R6_01160 [Candidatus Heimdallarchaeota archaeon]